MKTRSTKQYGGRLLSLAILLFAFLFIVGETANVVRADSSVGPASGAKAAIVPHGGTPSETTSATTIATNTPTSTSTPPTATFTPVLSPSPTATQDCGLAWRTFSSPNDGIANSLADVDIISPNDIWAVGSKGMVGHGYYATLVLHWDGISWSVISSPSTTENNNFLYAVAAAAPNDVWAVGEHGDLNMGYGDDLIMHWDGTSWSIFSGPVNKGPLHDVIALSSDNVWAVGGNGTTTILHWDGTSWSTVASPDPGEYGNNLKGITSISSSDMWAVGYSYINQCCLFQTLALHWDGTQWSAVETPNVGTSGNILDSVDAVNSNDVWAVGGADSASGNNRQTLIEHWDGSSWTVISSPNGGTDYNELNRVDVRSSNDIWAAGRYRNDGNGVDIATLVEHWDGNMWSISLSPSPGYQINELFGVAAVSSTEAWAVGYQYGSQSTNLVLRYNDPCVTPTATPTVIDTATPTVIDTATQIVTPSVSATSDTATPTITSTVIRTDTPQPTLTATACALQFSDVPEGSTFYPFVHCLACRGTISGYPDGTFRPGNLVTRGQLSKIVANAAGFSDEHSAQTFEDVALGTTFYDFVERLAVRGIVAGYACGGSGEPCGAGNLPYFRPNANVTRGQAAKIVSIADQLPAPTAGQQTFQDVPEGSTFWSWIESLASIGAIDGYTCGGIEEPCVSPLFRRYFRPGSNVSRGQATKIVSDTFSPGCATQAQSTR